MHGKKKHCSHEVYSVVEQMLNVNFVLAGSLQVRYKDTLAVQIVLHDMLWSLFWRQFVVWPAASAVGVERPQRHQPLTGIDYMKDTRWPLVDKPLKPGCVMPGLALPVQPQSVASHWPVLNHAGQQRWEQQGEQATNHFFDWKMAIKTACLVGNWVLHFRWLKQSEMDLLLVHEYTVVWSAFFVCV